jgi:uncharacterized protein
MIAPDANLLIYAYAPYDPFHRASREWLEKILSETEPVGIPIQSIWAFMRVQTHPRSRSGALTFQQTAEIVNSWLAQPHVRVIYPGDRHWSILQDLAAEVHLNGAQITDATIAATAHEYGAVVHTNDRDFARFHGFRWFNPLR